MTTQELQAKVLSLRGKMNDLVTKATTEKRELSADEGTQFDGFKSELETTKRNIDRLTTLDTESRSNNPNARIDPNADQGENPLGVPEKDLKNYSLLRAIRSLTNGRAVDGLEGELSKEIEKRSSKAPQGFYMYGSAISAIESRAAARQMERRDLTLTTGVGGINQTVLYQSFIDLLRAKTLVDKVGTRFMSGLVGKFFLPRQSAAGTAYWVGEGNAPTTSNQTIDQVSLNPNTLGAYTDISRQFMEQTSLDAEAFVRDDLAKILALEIDRVSFNGSGSSNQPTGILQTGSIPTMVLTSDAGNGGAVAWGDVVKMETTLSVANADMTNACYVTSAKERGALKTALRAAAAGSKFIWDDDNTVNGYKAFAGNNIPSNLTKGTSNGILSALLMGDFSSLIVGMWGGLDIMVDPFSRSTSGAVRVVALQDVDVELRHKESFVCVTAATN